MQDSPQIADFLFNIFLSNYSFFIIHYFVLHFFTRPWRNWQTLRTKDPVSQDVEVQALSAAPNSLFTFNFSLFRVILPHEQW